MAAMSEVRGNKH